MLDDLDIMTTLQREEPGQANETLGTWLAPDGSETLQFARLQEKAMQFADSIRSGRISQADAVMAMKSTIWKSLEFPMTTTSLSKKEWDSITRPILMEGLPKMSANRHFPKDINFTIVMKIELHSFL